MMKLKYLFENPALAEMLVKNWAYDAGSLELFKDFRISANAIYPFRQNGGVCFLRCSPGVEKSRQAILAELEFIAYLRGRGYPALAALPAKNGELLLQRSTPWGDYYASVFQRVSGAAISDGDYGDEVLVAYGAALGELHRLSSQYTAPLHGRWAYSDVLDWIDGLLRELGLDGPPRQELNLLRAAFSGLAKSPGTYGLIHYDFEPDNVFYDSQAHSCSVIDFDDAMFHWYGMDVTQALDNVQSELPAADFPAKKDAFLSGYRGRFALGDDQLAMMPLFRRFAALYRWSRVARTVQERWENEPGWMVELRAKLAAAAARDAQSFGAAL